MRFENFAEMSWPNPASTGDLEWRMRYAPETLTKSDRMCAASVIAAYRALILDKTVKGRQFVVRELKKRSRRDRTGEK